MSEKRASPDQASGATDGQGMKQGSATRRVRATSVSMVIVLVAYLALGTLYATATPAWQVPDEPAHYNYVKYVAEQGRLPELRPGDYPAEYLEEIKGRRFPPSMSIAPIRYESHQPPLYYALAATVYRLGLGVLGSGATDRELVVVLRLFSLLIGAITLLVAYRIVRRVYAKEPGLALGTAAFMAFLPMHLAMSAGVNNDSLAELMVALVAWRLVTIGGSRPAGRWSGLWSWRNTVGLGVLLGVALLTKMQSYVAVGLALLALGWDALATRRLGAGISWSKALARAAAMLGVALAVVLPWLARNMLLYGAADPLGMVRHDQVAGGQLTTYQFLAEHGAARLAGDLFMTTFHSFWGQFGWMGVPMPQRVYAVLGVVSALAMAGLAVYLWGLRGQAGQDAPPTRMPVEDRRGMALLAAWALATTLVFLWYNTKYVQHQGRYLFPALAPWGLAFTLGLRTILRRSPVPVLAVLGGALLALMSYAVWRGDFQEFYVGLTVSAAAGVGAGHGLERRLPGAALALVYLGLCGLALLCLYAYVVPNLRPPL